MSVSSTPVIVCSRSDCRAIPQEVLVGESVSAPVRWVFHSVGGLTTLAHDQESVAGADYLFDAGVFVAGDDEEQKRVGANVFVLGDGDKQPRGAGGVVALADDPELWRAPVKANTLLSLLVVLPMRRLVQRQ